MDKNEINALVQKMTIEEKAALLGGKTVWQTRENERLSIPSIFLSDGLMFTPFIYQRIFIL